jgi:hypothetical protein
VQRKVGRLSVKERTLQGTILDLKTQLKVQQQERDIAVWKLEIVAKRSADLMVERKHRLIVAQEKLVGVQGIAAEVLQKNRALAKRVNCTSGVLQRAIARTKARPMTTKLTRQGMYTVHARQMARNIIAAGAARDKVGPLMTKIAKIFGGKIHRGRSMSHRTASRCVLEGGIAARMQNTFELSLNEGAKSTYCDSLD